MSEVAVKSTPGAPPFVKMKAGATEAADPSNWDGWSVDDVKTGDTEKDYQQGADYCDLCLRKVIETDSVGALTFTLTAMIQKLVTGMPPSPMEKGFLDCLARRAADRRAQLDSN